MNVVISQPMYFPWVGLLEQIKVADTFVFYTDVQFTRGFYNRVQIKTPQGQQWMTIPLKNLHQQQKIDEVTINNDIEWREEHLNLLKTTYNGTPYQQEMLKLVEEVFEEPLDHLTDVSVKSTMALARYFELDSNTSFFFSRQLGIVGKSSQRLFDISHNLHAKTYITGHGARNYLDHHLFKNNGIDVEYMNYQCTPYPQLHGQFIPYVTGLDLIANCGRSGVKFINPKTTNWRSFTNESK
jgi:hypothetical protein